MFRKFYLLYGFLVLGTAAFGQYRGWSLDTVNQLKNVPKSVRDNPGSYRSVYGGFSHYKRGKRDETPSPPPSPRRTRLPRFSELHLSPRFSRGGTTHTLSSFVRDRG